MIFNKDREGKGAILAKDPSYSPAFQIFNTWHMTKNTGLSSYYVSSSIEGEDGRDARWHDNYAPHASMSIHHLVSGYKLGDIL
jgi:hypothetical protein